MLREKRMCVVHSHGNRPATETWQSRYEDGVFEKYNVKVLGCWAVEAFLQVLSIQTSVCFTTSRRPNYVLGGGLLLVGF